MSNVTPPAIEQPLYRQSSRHTGLVAGTRVLVDDIAMPVESLRTGMKLAGVEIKQIREIYIGNFLRLVYDNQMLCAGSGVTFPRIRMDYDLGPVEGKDYRGMPLDVEIEKVCVLAPAYFIWFSKPAKIVAEAVEIELPEVPMLPM